MKISRRLLRRVGRVVCSLALGGLGSWGLYQLGRSVTPPSSALVPGIYAPAVRQTETYRRQAQTWLQASYTLDAELLALVTTTHAADVYALSNAAQQALQTAADLSQAISLAYPPAALVSLRDSLQTTADTYLEAAFAVNTWVGEPTEDNYLAALEALRLARAAQASVAANPWVQTTAAPGTVVAPLNPVNPEVPDGWQQ